MAERFSTGGDEYPAQRLATVVSEGPRVANLIPVPTSFPAVPDLRLAPIARKRVITFANADNSTNPAEQFTINGKFYDHNRIDTTVPLGDVERWTIRNKADELHVFHIHQTDFQVVAINGKRRRFTGYQDTVNLPAATRKNGRLVPGEVTVIIPFTNPLMVGQFVYHCHIVQHADQGMMANIKVVAPAAPAAQAGPLGPILSPARFGEFPTLRQKKRRRLACEVYGAMAVGRAGQGGISPLPALQGRQRLPVGHGMRNFRRAAVRSGPCRRANHQRGAS